MSLRWPKKELAKRDQKTAGKLVSELMREALAARVKSEVAGKPKRDMYGFKPIPAGGYTVTNESPYSTRITPTTKLCQLGSPLIFRRQFRMAARDSYIGKREIGCTKSER